ncbi:MAG: hypothetical protein K0B14_10720, partial [Anaerolineaceae bacterium]|nr:hypothetical protein [Anaerolineaceae bacterium]
MNTKTKKKFLFPILIIILGLTITACAPLSQLADLSIFNNSEDTSSAPAEEPVALQEELDSVRVDDPVLDATTEGTLNQIYEMVNPSVVNIQVISTISEISDMPFSLPGFEDQEGIPQQSGLGSGF